MNAKKELATALFNLVRMDYGADLYNWTECDKNTVCNGYICISFYHLNSTTNAMYSGSAVPCDGSVNWQYAHENKKAEKQVKRAFEACAELLKRGKSSEMCDIFAHYKEAAQAVFNAKYSIERYLYIDNI